MQRQWHPTMTRGSVGRVGLALPPTRYCALLTGTRATCTLDGMESERDERKPDAMSVSFFEFAEARFTGRTRRTGGAKRPGGAVRPPLARVSAGHPGIKIRPGRARAAARGRDRERVHAHGPGRDQAIAAGWQRYLGWALTGAGAAMVPWLFVLATELPAHTTAVHWNTVWVGLDSLEALGLASTGLLLRRRDPRAGLTAAATATLLAVDAWFDVLTSAAGADRAVAIAMAAGAELPTAALCAYLAVRLYPKGEH